MLAVALATVSLCGMDVPSASRAFEECWRKTLVVGHRGAAAYAPENTLPSFRAAIGSGAVATECDVHLDADGGIAVIHDDTLDRTTTGKGPVARATSTELRALGVPSLEELTAVTKGKIVLVIEIKDGDGIEEKVVAHLRKEGMLDQAIVFSFDRERVAKVKSLEPGLKGVWLIGDKPTAGVLPGMVADAAAAKVDGVGFAYGNASEEAVAAFHGRRLPVFAWTVPPGEWVGRLRERGVNFIITNHPRHVSEQLADG
ncbi:MAG: hypothetical protein KIS66_03725 [Fimbriimonadaceae bacterium]|nr:hypothetical protein [Fimbriimonadaceae bacterium]